MNPQTKANYIQLQTRVSDFFSKVIAEHSTQMKCAQGCYSCCANGLSMSPLEADTIVDFLSESPDRLATIEKIQTENPHQGRHCVFLNAQGHCQVYEVRPIICRSHGAPVQYKYIDRDATFRDVCPLNFEGVDLDQLPTADVLNMETVNTLLSMLNSQHDRSRMQERVQMKDLIALAKSAQSRNI